MKFQISLIFIVFSLYVYISIYLKIRIEELKVLFKEYNKTKNTHFKINKAGKR